MMPTGAPDSIPTLTPTVFRISQIVGDSVGILSGDSLIRSSQMASGFAGHGGHSVKCRVQHCEVR
jgi:hypothetical protein